jgi:hypothetical protein
MIPSRIGTKGITVPLENQQNYWVLTLVERFDIFLKIAASSLGQKPHAVTSQAFGNIAGLCLIIVSLWQRPPFIVFGIEAGFRGFNVMVESVHDEDNGQKFAGEAPA